MDPRRSSKPSIGTQGHSNSRIVSHDLENKLVLLNRDDGEHHRGEVVVKIDGNSHDGGGFELPSPPANVNNPRRVQRNSSYRFWNEKDGNRPRGDGSNAANVHDEKRTFSFKRQQSGMSEAEFGEDPPSQLISSFLNKQRAAGSEFALDMDMDMDMDELRKNSPTLASCPKDLRVSFKTPETDLQLDHSSSSPSSDEDHGTGIRRRKAPRSPPTGNDSYGEVVHCTSNSSILHPGRPMSSMLLGKTRSRLLDSSLPPLPTTGVASPAVVAAAAANEDGRKSGRALQTGQLRSGQVRSSFIGKPQQATDEDETESLNEEDFPEEYRRIDFSCWSFLQWVSLIVIIVALACSLTMERLKQLEPLGLHLWKWVLFLLLLICGRLFSGWLVRFVVFCVERKFFRLRKRMLYFVYGVRHAVQNSLWLSLVLISWHLMLDKEVRLKIERTALPYLSIVTKILICLLVTTLLRLVKTLFVKVLASSFHVSTYFDRIQESLFNQYVIETLSGPPLMEIQAIREEEEQMMAEVRKLQKAGARMSSELQATALPNQKTYNTAPGKKSGMIGISARHNKDGKQQDEAITIDELHKLNQKNISAGRMKRMMRIVRYGNLTTLDEKVLQHAGEDESTTQIRSELEAKAAARKIFTNVARPRAKFIYLQDLMRFMKPEEAAKTMSMFDGGQQTNRANRRSLKNWVVNAFRERRALALTLNDTKTAVNKLRQVANFVVGVIIIAIWLVVMEIASSHFFVLLSSQALLLVFIFGNTLKLVFEAIIFLFVMHPFDVGDRCEVDGVQMIVEEMNIMTTIFLRFDNQKITYPNSVLATLPIGNFYRSPDMADTIDFCIHVATPMEKIASMREKLLAYVDSKKEHWYPGTMIILRDIDDMNRLKVSVWMRQRINFQDIGARFERREMVVQEIVKVARELEIEYRMLPLDVNVRNMGSMPQCTSARLPSTWAG